MYKAVNYYWYHHGLRQVEGGDHILDSIIESFKTKDFIKFSYFKKLLEIDYPDSLFLPNVAYAIDENGNETEIDITDQDNWMLITHEECECG